MNYGDKIIDTRDLEQRLDEINSEESRLEDEITEAANVVNEAQSFYDNELGEDSSQDEIDSARERLEDAQSDLRDANEALAEYREETASEKAELEEAQSEISEFHHGETLIHVDYWVEYVEELLKDIGDLPSNIPSYIVIDWEQTAENIRADYSSITLEGEEYYYRNC